MWGNVISEFESLWNRDSAVTSASPAPDPVTLRLLPSQFPTLHLVSASKLETNYIPPTVGSFPDFMAISKSGIICQSVSVVEATQIVYQ